MISNLGRTPLIATFIEISLVIHSHSIPIYNCFNYRIFVSVFVDIDIVNFFNIFFKDLFLPQKRVSHSALSFSALLQVKLQSIRIIVGDARFEPGTFAPEVWCAAKEPPNLENFLNDQAFLFDKFNGYFGIPNLLI